MIKRKDNCLIHGLTDVFLLRGKGNFACVKCLKELNAKINLKVERLSLTIPVYSTEELITCKA